jgi:hypothetical protein
MDHVIQVMTAPTNEEIHVQRPLRYLPYNLRESVIPYHPNGYVYCIMSLADFSTTYIGRTKNVPKRLHDHNSKLGGAFATRNINLKPFACIGFVVGFDEVTCSSTTFEPEWQNRRVRRGHHRLNPWQVLLIGMELVNETNRSGAQLKFIQCIELKSALDNQD